MYTYTTYMLYIYIQYMYTIYIYIHYIYILHIYYLYILYIYTIYIYYIYILYIYYIYTMHILYIYCIYIIVFERMENVWRLPIRFASPKSQGKDEASSPTTIRVSTGKLSQGTGTQFRWQKNPSKIGWPQCESSFSSLLRGITTQKKNAHVLACTLDILTGFCFDIPQQIC